MGWGPEGPFKGPRPVASCQRSRRVTKTTFEAASYCVSTCSKILSARTPPELELEDSLLCELDELELEEFELAELELDELSLCELELEEFELKLELLLEEALLEELLWEDIELDESDDDELEEFELALELELDDEEELEDELVSSSRSCAGPSVRRLRPRAAKVPPLDDSEAEYPTYWAVGRPRPS